MIYKIRIRSEPKELDKEGYLRNVFFFNKLDLFPEANQTVE